MKDYVMVTAVRNEEPFLPSLFQGVFSQTVKPLLWVIVNHGSKDNSAEIIKENIKGKDWIKSLYIPDEGISYQKPLEVGFNYVTDSIPDFEGYFGVLDSDVFIEPDYYEKLIEFIEANSLGMASGELKRWDSKKSDGFTASPRGNCRLYTRDCFFYVKDAMLKSPVWDTESEFLAVTRGWKVGMTHDARGVHMRKVTVRKMIKMAWMKGIGHRYLGYGLLYTLMVAAAFSIHPLWIVRSLIFLTGFSLPVKNTAVPEVREYTRHAARRYFARLGLKVRKPFNFLV